MSEAELEPRFFPPLWSRMSRGNGTKWRLELYPAALLLLLQCDGGSTDTRGPGFSLSPLQVQGVNPRAS